jgi:hypothetical protein
MLLEASLLWFRLFLKVSYFCPGLASTTIFLPMSSPSSWNHRHTPTCQAYFLRWCFALFCWNWSQTVVLLICTSQLAGLQVWTTSPDCKAITIFWSIALVVIIALTPIYSFILCIYIYIYIYTYAHTHICFPVIVSHSLHYLMR